MPTYYYKFISCILSMVATCNYYMSSFIGKGTQVWKKTGAIYDGDWQAGLRHGFGTYSIKMTEGIYMKEYAGGWKNDMRHVS